MTTVSAVTVNCRSRLTPRWPARAARLAKLLARVDSSFIAEQESYAAFRPVLDREYKKREPHLRVAGTNRGKVLRYRSDRYKIVTGSVRRYALGNGKHAVAALFTSRATPGFQIAVCSAHLINGKARNKAKRRAQARRLVQQLTADYAALTPHVLVLGDFNDIGLEDVMIDSSLRLGDAAHDIGNARRRNARFSTYHGFKKTPPTEGEHVDRAFRSASLRGFSWAIILGPKPYPTDHFPVLVRLVAKGRLS